MTIAESLKKYKDIEADLLLGHVLKQSKEFLYMNSDKKLTATQAKLFTSLAKQRKAGWPIAYLVGYKYFYGLKFKVNQNVLIPRPETEWLVDESLKLIKNKLQDQKSVRILDVGTGSGCIAISIAKNIDPKKVKVFASDISSKALSVARVNAKANHAKVNFSKHDLLLGIKGKFDIIVANLPYVPIDDYKKFYRNLKHEPKLALTDGANDFILIKDLLSQAPSHLNPGGILLLEMDPKTVKILRKFEPKPILIKDIKKLVRFARIDF